MTRIVAVMAMIVSLSACDPTVDGPFRREGAGLNLMGSDTAQNTRQLNAYLVELCKQSGYGTGSFCPPGPGLSDPLQWRMLVETGYNDIDARCDRYLTWIDDQRSRRIQFDGTVNALDLFTAGILKGTDATANTIANIGLTFGLSRELFDTYQSSILLGLEGSTIKEIVNERRAAHRRQFSQATYDSRPDAVFALRTYLGYCTPQSILTDINTLSRGAARGDADLIATQAERAAGVISSEPPRAIEAAGAPTDRGTTTIVSETRVFAFPAIRDEVVLFQQASCIDDDGGFGPQTRDAMRIFKGIAGAEDRSARITEAEWEEFSDRSWFDDACGEFGNLYEKSRYGPDSDDPFGKNDVATLVARDVLHESLDGAAITDERVRAALEGLWEAGGFGANYATDLSGQMTPEFREAILPRVTLD